MVDTFVPNFRQLILILMEALFITVLYNTIDKKKRKLSKNIIAVLLIVAIEVIETSIFKQFNLFISSCLLGAVFYIAFKEKLDDIILKLCLAIVLGYIIQGILLILVMLLRVKFGDDEQKYFGIYFLLNGASIIMAMGVYLYTPIEKLYSFFNAQIRKVFIFVINVVFFILALRTLIEGNRDYFTNHVIFFFTMPAIIIAINLIFYFYNLKSIEEKKVLETYNAYSPIMSNLIEDVRRRQHDFRNHLTTIYGLAQVSKGEQLSEKIKNYINSLTYSLEDYSYLIEINNKVMAAIIYNKICEAKDKNLNFLYEIHSDVHIPLQDFEVSEILNNLLDNAFRAAQEADTLNKEVSLEVGSDEGVDFIEVRNSVNKSSIKNIDKFSDRGFTTKNSSGHGYGLYNVKKAAEQNNGEVKISIEDEFITIKVEFQRNAGEKLEFEA